ncbi:hypothetical protein DCC81_25130 [Chitinophaga parva]|uniref:Uncharacterized protein n=1 Tax=Chitinophaga parva TaxID=2169414 RepID=A0A2T7BB65_9BACT|nr:hypothetical protein DCC81_25130 [Chitinophaga parva]
MLGFASRAQCPDGFTEKLSYNTSGGGTAYNYTPSLNIRACVENKPGLQGQQIFWRVKGYFRNYKYVRVTKIIKLTCGATIKKEVTLYGLKENEIRTGGSFAGDIDLSDNIFKETCNDPANRIASVSIGEYSCALADDDPLLLEEKNRLAKIELERKKAAAANGRANEDANKTRSSQASSGSSNIHESNSSIDETHSGTTVSRNKEIADNLSRELENNKIAYNAASDGIHELGSELLENQKKNKRQEMLKCNAGKKKMQGNGNGKEKKGYSRKKKRWPLKLKQKQKGAGSLIQM